MNKSIKFAAILFGSLLLPVISGQMTRDLSRTEWGIDEEGARHVHLLGRDK